MSSKKKPCAAAWVCFTQTPKNWLAVYLPSVSVNASVPLTETAHTYVSDRVTVTARVVESPSRSGSVLRPNSTRPVAGSPS